MLDLTMTVPEATVAEIETLSDPARGIVVEAWILPEETTELCSEDELHGPGLVQVPVRTITVDGTDQAGCLVFGPTRTVAHAQCLKCATGTVMGLIDNGSTWISVEVTR